MISEPARVRDFAARYTAAWCSQNAPSVAACYAQDGSLTVNGGTPAVGRKAITEVAQGFMSSLLVNFSGRATDTQGKAISDIAGVTFAIYKDQSEGAPLWMETQNVQVDARGNYTVQLGATRSDGLPLELFSSGVRPAGWACA